MLSLGIRQVCVRRALVEVDRVHRWICCRPSEILDSRSILRKNKAGTELTSNSSVSESER
jgi:hypothetical protein